jgi:hypothetical protein
MKCGVSWACVILLWSSAALCAPAANDLAAHKDAGTRLVTLIEAADKTSQLKTPQVTALVKRVSDDARMLRQASYTVADLGVIDDVCGTANKASVSFMLFGLKSQVNPADPQQQAQQKLIALMNQNTVVFQDELEKLQPFLLRCLAREIPLATQFVASLKPEELTPVRIQGLMGIRSGLLQVYSGVLQAANDTRFREDYRTAMLSVLAETSARFASVMDLSLRRRLLDAAQAAASKASDPYKPYLTRIATGLSSESCDGLCAVRK